MSSPDVPTVLRVLSAATAFSRRVGAEADAAVLQDYQDRFERQTPTFKLLRAEVDDAMSQASVRIREALLDDMGDPLPGKEGLVEEHERVWTDFLHAIFPPEWNEMDASKFRGAKHLDNHKISYKGDPSGVQPVVEGSIALIRRYGQLIGTGDFETAYSLTDAGLRGRMSPKKFAAEHDRAAQKYGGPALDFLLREFAYIYSDESVRESSNTSEEGWPKLTATENRRCRVIGFWIRDRASGTGSAGSVWIAEEDGEYRVAKFDFYKP